MKTTHKQSTCSTRRLGLSFSGVLDDAMVQEDGSLHVQVAIPRAMARAVAGAALLGEESVQQYVQRTLIRGIGGDISRLTRVSPRCARTLS